MRLANIKDVSSKSVAYSGCVNYNKIAIKNTLLVETKNLKPNGSPAFYIIKIPIFDSFETSIFDNIKPIK